MLRFCRCACLTASDLDRLETAGGRQESMGPRNRPADLLHQQDLSGVDRGELDLAHGDLCRCFEHCSRQAGRNIHKITGGGGHGGGSENDEPESTVSADAVGYPILSSFGEICQGDDNSDACPTLPQNGNKGSEEEGEAKGNTGGKREDHGAEIEGGGGGRGEGSTNGSSSATRDHLCRFPCRALSAQNELAALNQAKYYLVQARKMFPTTLEHDEVRDCPRVFIVLVLIASTLT